MPKPFENAEEVFFEQSDPRWGHLPYAGFTVSWAGCGLVAYTMCVDVVTGARFTPKDVYNMRKKWGVRQARPGGIFAKDAYVEYAEMHRERGQRWPRSWLAFTIKGRSIGESA